MTCKNSYIEKYKLISLAQTYMTFHFPGFAFALQ